MSNYFTTLLVLPEFPQILQVVTNTLGERFTYGLSDLLNYLQGDFYRSLQALEALYGAYEALERESRHVSYASARRAVNDFILRLLEESETDLGIRWEKGCFVPTGAQLLDEQLVNDPLKWLKGDSSLAAVLIPFERGLSHFIQAGKNPNILTDVINNMHESLEALAQIVTERPKEDLSSNRELFIKKIAAPEPYKELLKTYINYANELARHAREGALKPRLSLAEVESFVYLTGLFIRMAIQSTRPNNDAVSNTK